MSNSTTPWTVAYQVLLSMGLFKQKYWGGLPFASPGDLPDPGIEPATPTLVGRYFTTEPPGKPSLRFFRLKSEKKIPGESRNLLLSTGFPDDPTVLHWKLLGYTVWMGPY